MKLRLLCTESTRKSASLKLLAQALTAKLGYKVWRSIVTKPNRVHLKYGQSVDKIAQYRWFKEQNLPALEFTTSTEEAQGWLNTVDTTVFGRKYLNSSCGKGIVIFNPADLISQVNVCPVYTKYKKKKREFRVHVYKDTVVSVTEKRKRAGFEGERDTKIRNLANGYVFCQEVANEPPGLRELALAAAKVTPSDFRGVDIGYNERNNELFIIEVNSAPGIQGSNVGKYVAAI
jgi:glutathione synthase/RimK-type ligase-like ATP-grasp enzyme